MKSLTVCAWAALLLGATIVAADDDIRQERIQLAKGASSATVQGTIKGYQGVDYQLEARAGQAMIAVFEPSNLSAYFNVLPPGSQEALFVGSTSGGRFEGKLSATGLYTLRVYLMRNAARRNETSRYTLQVSLTGGGADHAGATAERPAGAAAFDRTLELQGIRFRVTQSGGTLRIAPAGLEIDNAPMVRPLQGEVTGAEIADLDADGSPEVYVYVRSVDAHGMLVAYSANRRKSLSEIYLPPFGEGEVAAEGYRGHDEYAVVENALARRFPIYREAGADAKPTGTRQIQYKLVPGEAGWLLKIDRVVVF